MKGKERDFFKKKAGVATTILEKGQPDLVIMDINTTHSKNRRIHYVTATIKNNSITPVMENFTLALLFEKKNIKTGAHHLLSAPIRKRRIFGLGEGQKKTCFFWYRWINPNEDVWQARFSAKVDFYNEVYEGEAGEKNNMGYGVWFPPY